MIFMPFLGMEAPGFFIPARKGAGIKPSRP